MTKKIISFLIFIRQVKIIFNNPTKKKLFIFDNSDIFSLKESILKNLDHFIYEDRAHLITKIYISFEILKIIFDYYKFGLKTAYSIAIIKIVEPKIVLILNQAKSIRTNDTTALNYDIISNFAIVCNV